MQTTLAESEMLCNDAAVITGRQVRAARAILRLGTRELAGLA